MVKKELESIIENDFSRFESGKLSPKERIPIVEKIIENCKLYLDKYRMPHKHRFMNDNVKITSNFLDELERMKQELIKTI